MIDSDHVGPVADSVVSHQSIPVPEYKDALLIVMRSWGPGRKLKTSESRAAVTAAKALVAEDQSSCGKQGWPKVTAKKLYRD